MSTIAQSNGLGFLPYFLALLLSGGSLLTYLVGAVVSKYGLAEEGRTARAFNLSLPLTQKPETLFAVSLAAAQTTFSTVFIAFLTGAASLGLHLLYCPFAFAVGNWFMFVIYKRIDAMGYIDGSSNSGLIPFFVYRLCGSRLISLCVAGISVLPIVAILALELYYGIPLLDHLGQKAFPFISFNSGQVPIYAWLFSFGLFACFMALLLGYVFVGGFRAVVTSDVWQYRIMATTLFLILLSVLATVLGERHTLSWGTLWTPKPPHPNFIAFYAWVTIVDFLSPLCFATTWQRFRAFRDRSTNFSAAVRRAIVIVVCLWLMLIFIGIGLQLLSPSPQEPVSPAPQRPVTVLLPDLLDRVGNINLWFQLFVFPLIVVAGFSGMYSSSDTCVSALLYLTETNRSWHLPTHREDAPLRRHYYWVMAAIFAFTFVMYFLYRFVPTLYSLAPKPLKPLNPVAIALSIFGNTVVLAPTILLLTKMRACTSEQASRIRSAYIGTSVVLGFLTYWLFWLYGLFTTDYPVPAIVAGLIAAAVPAYLLLSRERRATELERIQANV